MFWGDLPYSPRQEATGVPNLIADMNAQRLASSVHDGDLKQGANSLYDAALYERSLGCFNALEAPAMFTPGDNDWTDCDRPSNGGYWSLERLDYERLVFSAHLRPHRGPSPVVTGASRTVESWRGAAPD